MPGAREVSVTLPSLRRRIRPDTRGDLLRGHGGAGAATAEHGRCPLGRVPATAVPRPAGAASGAVSWAVSGAAGATVPRTA
ncbi:hypothetical protein GCM10009767_34990 [Kocuria aegyptia]|uniref:Uncharacterized protein n=1 Tax=Kocuria aegyptia TaxID=330943 RepID=A0ABP4XCL5_9MICC